MTQQSHLRLFFFGFPLKLEDVEWMQLHNPVHLWAGGRDELYRFQKPILKIVKQARSEKECSVPRDMGEDGGSLLCSIKLKLGSHVFWGFDSFTRLKPSGIFRRIGFVAVCKLLFERLLLRIGPNLSSHLFPGSFTE